MSASPRPLIDFSAFGVVSSRRAASFARRSTSSLVRSGVVVSDLGSPCLESPEPIALPRKIDPETLYLRRSRQALKNAVSDLFQAWADLESSLAFLFAVAVIKPGLGSVGFEIYFALSNMETRVKLVDTSLTAALRHNDGAAAVLSEWTTILNAINRAKGTRNAVAHGCTMITSDAGPLQYRIGPPQFHLGAMFKAMGRGANLALSANDISQSADAVWANAGKIRALASAAGGLIDGNATASPPKSPEPATDHSTAAPPKADRKPPRRKPRH